MANTMPRNSDAPFQGDDVNKADRLFPWNNTATTAGGLATSEFPGRRGRTVIQRAEGSCLTRSFHQDRTFRLASGMSLGSWRRLAGVFGLCSLGSIYGAAPVEESVAEQVRRANEAVSAPQRGDPSPNSSPIEADTSQSASQSASQLGQLFYQLQLLRDEVQRLNGALEEQQNQIERLAREQHERYLGLDRRIAELDSGSTQRPDDGSPNESGFGAERPPQQPGAVPTERDTYESAYELMQSRQFEPAAEAFERLIEEYPNGQYTPNAFYWLGELHRKNGDAEAARQSFVMVVDLYPDHNKVPDALYKLGVVYTQLDEPTRAIEYLDRVVREYPDSTAASLAERHAAELR